MRAITGNWRDFETARRFEQPSFFDPLAGHRDELKGLHVNTHIPKVIGAARRYELTGDPYYHEVAKYFWDEVTSERAYVTGGTSNGESWNTDPGDLKAELSLWSEECCCGYNMLKLTRHLYQWTADPRYFDYYERTLFNSRLGTQDARGMKMYYLPCRPAIGSSSIRTTTRSGAARARARKSSRSSAIRFTSTMPTKHS